MTPITPKDYYDAHIAEEKEYVRVYLAYKVKGGEEILVGSQRMTAAEDSYLLTLGGELDHRYDRLMSAADFAARTTPAADLLLPAPKKELSEASVQTVTPVKKGDAINPYKLKKHQHARADGFIVSIKAGATFMTNHALMSKFNYAGQKFETENLPLVTVKGEMPIHGIIIQEMTPFALKDGSTYFETSGLLQRDAATAEGYQVNYSLAPNADLRLSPAWSATHDPHTIALDNQAKLKTISLKRKLARNAC